MATSGEQAFSAAEVSSGELGGEHRKPLFVGERLHRCGGKNFFASHGPGRLCQHTDHLYARLDQGAEARKGCVRTTSKQDSHPGEPSQDALGGSYYSLVSASREWGSSKTILTRSPAVFLGPLANLFRQALSSRATSAPCA